MRRTFFWSTTRSPRPGLLLPNRRAFFCSPPVSQGLRECAASSSANSILRWGQATAYQFCASVRDGAFTAITYRRERFHPSTTQATRSLADPDLDLVLTLISTSRPN